MTSEVRGLLDALHDGTMTLDEVTKAFRGRKWPRRTRPTATSYLESGQEELQDPDPYMPNSYDDVTLAYDQGRLSDEQYAVLAGAMAEAQRAEDTGDE